MAIGPQNQRDQLMVVVALCAVLTAGAYWYFFFDPRSTAREELAQRVEIMETANTRARAELARGNPEDLKRQAAEYAENLEMMRLLVPAENELPGLLEQVSTAARRVGLDIASVEPVPVITGDEFDTYRYRLSLNGGYHRVGEFLANVGSLSRIVAPVNIQLEMAQGTAAAAGPKPKSRPAPQDEALMQTKFEIQTFVARASTVSDSRTPVVLTETANRSNR